MHPRLLKLFLLLSLIATVCLSSAANEVSWSADAPAGKAGDVVTVKLHASIQKGFHLYSQAIVEDGPQPTEIKALPPLTLAGKPKQAPPIKKLDQNFGKEVEFYEGETTFEVPVKLGAEGNKGSLQVRFMTCNDRMCIPPATVTVPLGGGSATVAGATSGPKAGAAGSTDSFTTTVTDAKAKGLLAFVGLSFSLGLLSLLTPCVFPMVPITVSFFAKRREQSGSKSGLSQAAAYCLGIIGSFAGFGLLVTLLFGASGIQRFATNPIVNILLGILFVALALSLFGAYELALPSGMTNRFSPDGKAGLIAPILMGLTFTLTSFTCTVPFVGTILASAASGDIVYPLVGMLSFGTAFALPFFLLALFPQFLAKLPRSGSWLETVKGFMGFLELAAALKFFSNSDLVWRTGIFPRPVFLVIWVVLGIAAGVYLFGGLPFVHGSKTPKLGPGRIAIALLSFAAAIWMGSAVGGKSLGELEAFLPPSESDWIKDYNQGLRVAQQTGRPLLVNFTGVTCTNCRWMEKNMFTRSDVKSQLKNYVLVELYTDRETPGDVKNKDLQQKLSGVVTLPVYVEVSPAGEKLKVFQGSTRDSQEFIGFLQNKTILSAMR